jgi:putative hydrolase of the HAD superfamily
MNHLDGIRAVVFDAVGTVIFPNPSAVTVYTEVAAKYGLHLDPANLGPKLWAQFRIEEERDRADGWRTSENRERLRWRNIVNAAIPGATSELFEELFQHFAQPHAWKVPESAGSTIANLESRGLMLGMGSNYDSRLIQVVDGIPDLWPLQANLVISSLVGYRKPAEEFFLAVQTQLKLPPREILFVGDDVENDYEGALQAGFRAVLLDDCSRNTSVPQRIDQLLDLLR